MTESELNNYMMRFQTEQFLNDIDFQSSYSHDVIWECREYLVTRGIPMENLGVQDKLFALGMALVKRYGHVVEGRSIKNLKHLFGKMIDVLVVVYEYGDDDGKLNLQSFKRTPFVELTTLADDLPDPADYWKTA
jgi:hypothetical protein